MTICRHCGKTIHENFCASCGHPATLKRIDGQYVSREIQHTLHLERGYFFTVRELFIRPGLSIREYLAENRTRHIKPITFLIVTSLIYTLLNSLLNIESQYIEFDTGQDEADPNHQSSLIAIFQWVQNHYGYANILMGAVIAIWLKIFFKKSQYNIFEIITLLCYVMGQSMLIMAFGMLLVSLTNFFPIFELTGYAFILYATWAIGQFFDKQKVASYVKALLSYLLGMMTCLILAIIIGLSYDYIFK